VVRVAAVADGIGVAVEDDVNDDDGTDEEDRVVFCFSSINRSVMLHS
jgi:hypothetical protein